MSQAPDLAGIVARRRAAADGFVRVDTSATTWTALAEAAAAGRHDLLSLWIDDGSAAMALIDPKSAVRAIVRIPLVDGAYPSVGAHHPAALRIERAMRDLGRAEPAGLPDQRPWLDHGAWQTLPPGRKGKPDDARRPYAFLPVEGDNLHQIPVGPVHAGIIEPGHFRFTASGEAVVRLEQRLGYVHKGIEALAEGKDIAAAGRIAARISGDSTVAYSFAFALAVEAALGIEAPHRAACLRGIMAELERMSHHVNDVGAICNDASVAALQAHATLIREDVMRSAAGCFGHRMMMDCIVPGGVTVDLEMVHLRSIGEMLIRTEQAFAQLVKVYDTMPSLLDRTVTTGIVKPELARAFGAGGYVGRASGRAFDARAAMAYPPYDTVRFAVPTRKAGDVDARVWIRIEEVAESIAIIRQLIEQMEPGPVAVELPKPRAGEGVALVEAFRGDLLLALRLDADGRVARFHARDASWFQWPLLEAAIEGNIVADFPLCNKSFNCSYSGQDI